jgi:hypothetical protein
VLLALELQRQNLGDLRIDLGERPVEEIGRQFWGAHSATTLATESVT